MNNCFIECNECWKLKHENEELQSRLREKEGKLKTALQQLNANVSKAKKDKLALQNENHRMRIKYAESKVGQMLRNSSKSTPNLHQIDSRERYDTSVRLRNTNFPFLVQESNNLQDGHGHIKACKSVC